MGSDGFTDWQKQLNEATKIPDENKRNEVLNELFKQSEKILHFQHGGIVRPKYVSAGDPIEWEDYYDPSTHYTETLEDLQDARESWRWDGNLEDLKHQGT